MQPYLDAFARRFNEYPSPVTAALYSLALLRLAGMERGAAWAHQTAPSQWAGFAAAMSSGASVLDHVCDQAEQSFIWHEVAYQMSVFVGAGRDALDEAKAIFDGGLRAIDHGSWQGATPEISMERAVRAYMYARDSV